MNPTPAQRSALDDLAAGAIITPKGGRYPIVRQNGMAINLHPGTFFAMRAAGWIAGTLEGYEITAAGRRVYSDCTGKQPERSAP